MARISGREAHTNEFRVATDLLSKGFHVLESINYFEPFDLGVFYAGKFFRVEVTSGKHKPDGVTFPCKDASRFDLLAVVVDGEIFYSPELAVIFDHQPNPPRMVRKMFINRFIDNAMTGRLEKMVKLDRVGPTDEDILGFVGHEFETRWAIRDRIIASREYKCTEKRIYVAMRHLASRNLVDVKVLRCNEKLYRLARKTESDDLFG